VPANVDDVAEIGHGEVIEVAGLMLLQRALPTFGTFGIPEPTAFFLDIVFIFYDELLVTQ
jgi:hypothetical protein